MVISIIDAYQLARDRTEWKVTAPRLLERIGLPVSPLHREDEEGAKTRANTNNSKNFASPCATRARTSANQQTLSIIVKSGRWLRLPKITQSSQSSSLPVTRQSQKILRPPMPSDKYLLESGAGPLGVVL